MSVRKRIEELEDAITDAGIILGRADTHFEGADDPHDCIKRAMQRLEMVMKDPAVLKRQGI